MSSEKVGRNDPCHCGSGKKYKKCCLGKDDARVSTDEATPSAGPTGRSNAAVAAAMNKKMGGAAVVSPYTIAKMAEDPRAAGDNPELRRTIELAVRTGWTIKKLEAMPTGAIEAQIQGYGVHHSIERFLRLAEGGLSAWSLSETWIAEDRVHRSGKAGGAEDFLGLAACELWKRLLPDRPSVEMIDDWMQGGYVLLEEKKGPETCDLWWKSWSAIRDRILQPEMRTMSLVDRVLQGYQSIFNWSQDLERELGNAAIKDLRFAALGRRFCSEWLAQFTDESAKIQAGFVRALGRFLMRLGELQEAERVLGSAVERWPDDPWVYICLADAYAQVFRGEHLPLDLDKARTLLERAQTIRGLEARDRQVVEARLKDLAAR
jgi:hypothetical protein